MWEWWAAATGVELGKLVLEQVLNLGKSALEDYVNSQFNPCTIAQGDTRSTGLQFICNNGGIIYNATRRYKWPGLAAVVVSLVHILKSSKL
jgi:hypothetical protein